MKITHLCFADDLLLFAKGDCPSVQAMMECLKQFSAASGLQANMGESCIYFGGVSQQERLSILQSTSFSYGELPFKNLEVPLSTKKISIIQWQPLILKIVCQNFLLDLKKALLCCRAQLMQSVLFGVQAYRAQLFVLPAKVIKLIDSYCRSYLWSASNTITKKALIAWTRVCSPVCFGGINLTNIGLWNRAAIAKIHRALANKEDRLWIRWVHTYYIQGQPFESIRVPQRACWMIRKIIEARSSLNQFQCSNTCGKSLIRQLYLQLLDSVPRVMWKNLTYQNAARPKARFTFWL
ncbi:uncharacterized protein LOC132630638 [Lycium barbarum]|uniref:uncharacterized protein LOC132630638 n=1 Tax=Lycium barbarum TaxID=112863 RepID=UPI00293E7CC6|nr:uncharacterized protein LOC132630638 [Lycium barbarum]